MKAYYVYILLCNNKSYYTGYTTDIKRRYQEHCDGSIKCKYTRSFPPVEIAACWKIESDNSSPALKLERLIKKLPKSIEIKLIDNTEYIHTVLEEDGGPKLNISYFKP
jgi:putative endonuclease